MNEDSYKKALARLERIAAAIDSGSSLTIEGIAERMSNLAATGEDDVEKVHQAADYTLIDLLIVVTAGHPAKAQVDAIIASYHKVKKWYA